MLLNYVRDKNRQRIGIVVALDKDQIGWSKCNTRLDRFNKETGVKIAKGRAESRRVQKRLNVLFQKISCGDADLIRACRADLSLPKGFANSVAKMRERAFRYFKEI